MTLPSAKPDNGHTARRPNRWPSIAAGVAVVLLGLVLLADNVGMLTGGAAGVVAFWPVLLVALGVLVLSGRPWLASAARPFAIERRDYTHGELSLKAGWVAERINVNAFAGNTQLAVGQFPAQAGPHLEADGARARVSLEGWMAARFRRGDWSISLAKNLPWSCEIHTHLSQVTLDLRDLTVTMLSLWAWTGDVELTIPASGSGRADVRVMLGDVTVRVPESAALKLVIQAGPLSEVAISEASLIPSAPGEWTTPNYPIAEQRFILTMSLGAGDLRVV
jgi:hypothetical protein